MTEEKTFEPITTQEAFNERIKARLARERERWEKGSDAEELRTQLAAKEEEISTIRREHFHDSVRRQVVDDLHRKGITGQGRIDRILRHVDFDAVPADADGAPNRISIDGQLANIHEDMPELLPEKFQVGAGSGGSSKPLLSREAPLTREEVEAMDESQINSNWDRVKAFMAGQR
jgi:hypothetical protein